MSIIRHIGMYLGIVAAVASLVAVGMLFRIQTAGEAEAAYMVDQSLRFNDDDSTYLSKTFSSAGTRTTWTFSAWVKRSALGTGPFALIGAGANGSNQTNIFFSSDQLCINAYSGGAEVFTLCSNAYYRDPTAWMHVVVVIDTTNATSANRVKMYVDGEEITSFLTSNYPSLNAETFINNNQAHGIGRQEHSPGDYFDGYMSDVYFIDGTALTPSSFGETDSNGYWRPKAYTGSYGTNGFHLDFANSADLGNDVSGNNNDWTANNLATTDQIIDTPTSGFPTLNPIMPGVSSYSPATLQRGNLRAVGSNGKSAIGTFAIEGDGKWVWEYDILSGSTVNIAVGVQEQELTGLTSYAYLNDGRKLVPVGGASAYGATYTSGDIITITYNDGSLHAYKNGVDQGEIASGLNDGRVWYPFILMGASPANDVGVHINFGQDSIVGTTYYADAGGYFVYEPPTDHKALSTANLPEPAVVKPSNYFDTATYTGNGSTQSVVDLNFQPSFVWLKDRDATNDHGLFDSVRGAYKYLTTNVTSSETTSTSTLTSFNVDGFSLGTSTAFNSNSNNYVSWNWKEDPDAGFDIVSYTGNGSNQTVAHSLNAVPKMMVVKRSDDTGNWQVYHEVLGSGYSLLLNSTAATSGTSAWNNTAPTSTVFSVGAVDDVNASGNLSTSQTFSYTGGAQTFTVPSGVTSITVKMWGGGGGFSGQCAAPRCQDGGGSGYAQSTISVTPGDEHTIWVGGAGGTANIGPGGGGSAGWGGGAAGGSTDSNKSRGGGGGGGCSVFFATDGSTRSVVAAGGGGAGGVADGTGSGAGIGGPGGGSSGSAGGSSAAGSGGAGGNSPDSSGGAGSAASNSGGGGGGGGCGGGGGGIGGSTNVTEGSGGGGGASRGDSTSSGSGLTPGNSGDSDRNGAGVGGDASTATAASAGRVVINYTVSANTSYVAYLFAEKDGFSRFGSYIGTGSTNGPFVYTGFKPRFVMVKRTDVAQGWNIYDTARDTYNPVASTLYSNENYVEGTNSFGDILSNGFKIRTTHGDFNASSGNYVYAAFADVPLKYSAYSAASASSAALANFLFGFAF